jgi:hypothetical protein
MSFAIGITTFKARLKRVQSLVNFIRSKGDWPIVLAVNGEYKCPFDENYRKDILQLAANTKNCMISMFPEFRSLSKLWNTLLITSPCDWNFILNDDVIISEGFSFEALENVSKQNSEENICAINGSWSHYFVNRKLIAKVGWFEERLLGIGEEDTDMFWRIQSSGKCIYKTEMPFIVNYHDGSKVEGVKSGIMHYTAYNRDFIFNKKYSNTDSGIEGMFGMPMKRELKDINSYPNETFYWENKFLLD